ncbi:unnamed protein product [Rotaria sp. Silwood2]|nr:unnamed protein product [Rotaria sp. Silwood2]CAF4620701.1 unnamed protein product [Rotaria sp. Silwood2]CAF4654287.1 unnamed protein product [Rotaria sp. Silwood2]CAF4769957.1 unnamed protein product [Rotaria sp. Silwood2]
MNLNAEITLKASAALFGICIRFDPALTRFAVDDTIEILAFNMFIETWINDTSYARYFDACAPKECTCAYLYRFDTLEMLTTFLSIFSALSGGLRFFISHLISTIAKIKNRLRIIPAHGVKYSRKRTA